MKNPRSNIYSLQLFLCLLILFFTFNSCTKDSGFNSDTELVNSDTELGKSCESEIYFADSCVLFDINELVIIEDSGTSNDIVDRHRKKL